MSEPIFHDTFSINFGEGPAAFAKWLEGVIILLKHQPVFCENGDYLMPEMPRIRGQNADGSVRINVDGKYRYVDSTGNKAFRPADSMITFDLWEKKDVRGLLSLDIKAKCYEADSSPYYRNLRGRIGERWPESGLKESNMGKGGPSSVRTSNEVRRRIVLQWFGARRRGTKREDFARDLGISDGWLGEFVTQFNKGELDDIDK